MTSGSVDEEGNSQFEDEMFFSVVSVVTPKGSKQYEMHKV